MVKKKSHGFTIIELAIAITVIAILAFVLITNFSFSSSNLMTARVKLMNDIRYVQSLAVNRGGTYGIEFVPASESYSLYVNSPSTKIKDPQKPTTDFEVNYSTIPELSGVTIISASFGGSPRLEFNWQGIPYSGTGSALSTDGTVVIQSGSNSETIRVRPNTGRVSY